MGCTQKSRTLLITDDALAGTAEVKALAAKGHTIKRWEDYSAAPRPDLFLGYDCRMVRPETVKYLALALLELGKPPAIAIPKKILDNDSANLEEEEDVSL